MAVSTPYTTEALITRLMGALGLSLRNDDTDSGTTANMMLDAIDAGTNDLDFYLSDYSQSEIAASEWAQDHATYFAVRFWCKRRLNEVPEGLKLECERREKQLELVRTRKAKAPRLAKSRRPVAVTNCTVVLRDVNNQVKVDKTRSTGVAQDYQRPDANAPDAR